MTPLHVVHSREPASRGLAWHIAHSDSSTAVPALAASSASPSATAESLAAPASACSARHASTAAAASLERPRAAATKRSNSSSLHACRRRRASAPAAVPWAGQRGPHSARDGSSAATTVRAGAGTPALLRAARSGTPRRAKSRRKYCAKLLHAAHSVALLPWAKALPQHLQRRCCLPSWLHAPWAGGGSARPQSCCCNPVVAPPRAG